MVPPLTLSRPGATAPEDRQLRAVGNDGLTDAEREEYARVYRTSGAGRQPGAAELADVAAWLTKKRGGARLA